MTGKREPRSPSGSPTDRTPKGQSASSIKENPVWRFKHFDTDPQSPWSWTKLNSNGQELIKILEKLREFESMPWKDILGDKNHRLRQAAISNRAQQRLNQLGLSDEADNICSLRIDSKKRVVGILRGSIFYLLWWDPNHEVCPSRLR